MQKWGFSAIFSRLVHPIDLILHILDVLNGLHRWQRCLRLFKFLFSFSPLCFLSLSCPPCSPQRVLLLASLFFLASHDRGYNIYLSSRFDPGAPVPLITVSITKLLESPLGLYILISNPVRFLIAGRWRWMFSLNSSSRLMLAIDGKNHCGIWRNLAEFGGI